MMPQRVKIPCTICGEEAKQRCSACSAASYCSMVCQETDWSIHKMLCGCMKDFLCFENATGSARRVVIFGVDAKIPVFGLVNMDLGSNDLKGIEKLFGKEMEKTRFDFNSVRGTPLQRKTFLFHVKLGGNEPINECIRNLKLVSKRWGEAKDTHTVRRAKEAKKDAAFKEWLYDPDRQYKTGERSEAFQPLRIPNDLTPDGTTEFRGTVIAAIEGPKGAGTWGNIQPDDFRQVVDNLMIHGHSSETDPVAMKGRQIKIKGTRVNCKADMAFVKREQYEYVKYPQDHPACLSDPGHTYSLLRLLGLPIKMATNPYDRAWAHKSLASAEHNWILRDNEPALHLNTRLDPGERRELFGSSYDWEEASGSVNIVRVDGRDLGAEQVEAIVMYQQNVVVPMCQAAFNAQEMFEEGDPRIKEIFEECVSKINKESFLQYWDKLKADFQLPEYIEPPYMEENPLPGYVDFEPELE